MALAGNSGALFLPADYRVIKFPHTDFGGVWWGIESCKVSDISIDNKLDAIESVPENSGIISVLSVSFRVSIVQQSIVQGLKIPFANRNSVPIES